MSEETHKYAPEHKAIYEAIRDSVDVKKHKARVKRHSKAWGTVMDLIANKEVTHMDEGLEALADAVIQYKKMAKLPVSDDPDNRHYIISEIEQLIDRLFEKEGGKEAAINLLKEGKGPEVLSRILSLYQNMDIGGHVKYMARKKLPENANFETLSGIVRYHASLHPTEHFSEGDIAAAANRESVIEMLANAYTTELGTQIKKMKSKTQEPGYKKAA